MACPGEGCDGSARGGAPALLLQALLQLTALNMETELALVTGAAWALNNLALGSEENAAAVLACDGVPRLLRIIRAAPVM